MSHPRLWQSHCSCSDERRIVSTNSGFTLVELMRHGHYRRYRRDGGAFDGERRRVDQAGQATREVEREMQDARITAVSANQPMRVRFDCPRRAITDSIELIGTSVVARPQPTAPPIACAWRLSVPAIRTGTL